MCARAGGRLPRAAGQRLVVAHPAGPQRHARYDPTFRTTVDAAIAAPKPGPTREPQRADAWFFLGAAYGARVSFRVQRGERLAAARDGKRIKESLERALELDPQMDDARFGIGLYKYYADIAPAAPSSSASSCCCPAAIGCRD